MDLCWQRDAVKVCHSFSSKEQTSFNFMAADAKESACNTGDLGSIPGLGRSSGEGNGNPL